MPSRNVYDSVSPGNVFTRVKPLYDTKTPFGIMYYLNGAASAWPVSAIEQVKLWTPYSLGVDVNAEGIGDVLDVERYDATPEMAPSWLLERRSDPAQVIPPGVYCNKSTWPAVITEVNLAGINHPPYFISDPTGVLHLVPGSAATQWAWMAGYDVSTTSETWPWPDPPVVQPYNRSLLLIGE